MDLVEAVVVSVTAEAEVVVVQDSDSRKNRSDLAPDLPRKSHSTKTK